VQTSLIIPVPDAEGSVREWRTKFDPSAALGVAAHITVAAPFLPANRVTPEILQRLSVIADAHTALTIALDRVAQLPGAVALLPVQDHPLRLLTTAIVEAWPGLGDELRSGRGRPYHLTAACVEDRAVFDEIEKAVRPSLPIRTHLHRLQLLAHSASSAHTVAEFPFAADPPLPRSSVLP
jgi:2'-5' RNA ligase superfamily